MDEEQKIRVFLLAGYSPSYGVIRTLLKEGVNLVGVLSSPEHVQSIGWKECLKNFFCFGNIREPKRLLKNNHVPLYFTETYNNDVAERIISDAKPDVLLLYGSKIIKPNILAIPKIGTLNAHSALLPKYRGGASEFWMFFNQEFQYAGVTIHWVTPGLDVGDIFLQEPLVVNEHDNPRTLRLKGRALMGPLFVKAIRLIERGICTRLPQDESQSSKYKQPTEEERKIYEQRYGKY